MCREQKAAFICSVQANDPTSTQLADKCRHRMFGFRRMAFVMVGHNVGKVLDGIPPVDVVPDKGTHAIQFKSTHGERNISGEEAGKPRFQLYRITDANISLGTCLQADIATLDGNGVQCRILRKSG